MIKRSAAAHVHVETAEAAQRQRVEGSFVCCATNIRGTSPSRCPFQSQSSYDLSSNDEVRCDDTWGMMCSSMKKPVISHLFAPCAIDKYLQHIRAERKSLALPILI